mgnify:CR=1 FL=1
MSTQNTLQSDPDSLPDQTLLNLIQRGSQDESQAAMSVIYQRYAKGVWGFIYSKVQQRDIVEDITSEVWFVVIQKIHTYEWRGNSLRSWIFFFCYNKILEHQRTMTKEALSLDYLTDIDIDIDRHTPASPPPDPEERDSHNTRPDIQVITDGIDSLREKPKQIIRDRFFENLTTTEIAHKFNITEGAVRIAIMRALDSLRQHLMQRRGKVI